MWEDPQDLGGWRILGKSGRTEQMGEGVRREEAGRRCGEQGFRPERITEAGEPSAKFGGEVPIST